MSELETHRTLRPSLKRKPQVPTSKIQRNIKIQFPFDCGQPIPFGALNLEFLWSLDVGFWSFGPGNIGICRLGDALPSNQFLHAVILRVRHVEVTGGVQRHTPRVAEPAWHHARTANDLQRLIVRIEDLDTAVAKFANVLPPCGIHTNIVRITQFAFARAGLAVGPDELAVSGKDLDAMIA